MTHVVRNVRYLKSAAAAVVAVLCGSIDAQTPAFVPAGFGETLDAINALSCPRRANVGVEATVSCRTVVEGDGALAMPSYCYTDSGKHRAYRYRVQDVLRNARFAPASVNGDPVPVYFSFRVIFQVREDACHVSAVPNLGSQGELTSTAFVAPQEIVTNDSWARNDRRFVAELFSYGRSARRPVSPYGTIFVLSAVIYERGRTSNVRLERNQGKASPRALAVALPAFQGARFIPAFVDGQPRAMRYYHPFRVGDLRCDWPCQLRGSDDAAEP